MKYKDYIIENNVLITVNKDIKEFVIPNSVTSIGVWIFYGCSDLTSIIIPNSVTSIGDNAFYGCKSLTSITILNSVTEIGKRAFHSCIGLKSITIPNSVTSIGNNAFYDCSSLTSITIPNSVTEIEDYTFYKTPFENVFKKLNTKQFIKFVNSKDKVNWVGKYNIELNDIILLLDKEEYNGFNSGVSYGL